MNAGNRCEKRREGFTLVEILVVLAIIAILAGLLVPVVIQMLNKGPDTMAQTEINQLSTAVESFKSNFKVPYIPSHIRLAELFTNYNLSDPLDADSVAYLTRIWPQLLSADPTTGVVQWQTTGIDWNGDGTIDKKNKVELEGDQCLVFFTGGIPTSAPGVLGFSTNPRDPAALKQTTGRLSPFFEFPSSRLYLRSGDKGASAKGFFSFADAYTRPTTLASFSPYAYFSNYGTRNGYKSPITAQYAAGGDCGTLGVFPYFSSKAPVLFLNPSGFQIISAGADRSFGAGGGPFNGNTGAGADDRSNFNNGALLTTVSN